MKYDDLPKTIKVQIKEKVQEDIENLLWGHPPKHGFMISNGLQYRLAITDADSVATINVPTIRLEQVLMSHPAISISDDAKGSLEKTIVNARVVNDDLLWYGVRWVENSKSPIKTVANILFLIAKKPAILLGE